MLNINTSINLLTHPQTSKQANKHKQTNLCLCGCGCGCWVCVCVCCVCVGWLVGLFVLVNTNTLTHTSMQLRRSISRHSNTNVFASILEKSSTSFITVLSIFPQCIIVSTHSRWYGVILDSANNWPIPTIPESGVRTSWLMLAKNRDLAVIAAWSSSESVRSVVISVEIIIT